MKPHPRVRRTIKWGGAVITALLIALWIASRWCGVMCGTRTNDWGIGLFPGGVTWFSERAIWPSRAEINCDFGRVEPDRWLG